MAKYQKCESFSQGAKGTEGFKKEGIFSIIRGNSEVQNRKGGYFFQNGNQELLRYLNKGSVVGI